MRDPNGERPSAGALAGPSAAEIRTRHSALRAVMVRAELDALLVFGNLASPHPIRYLTRWPPGWDAFLVLPAEGQPRLLVPSENHVPTAIRLSAEVSEASWVGPDPAAGVLAALRSASGPGTRRVGIVGPLPWLIHARLVVEPWLELTGADDEFRRFRMVKSPAEIERSRQAAALADRAVLALIDGIRPGLRDDQLAGLLQDAYRAAGGEDGICFLASSSMAGGGPVVPEQVLTDRRIATGDMVAFELSVGVGGDWSQVLRTICLGPPSPEVRRLHATADAAFTAIFDRVRPGATAADLLQAARCIDDAGLTVVDDVVHGYGGGYMPPVLRTPRTQRRAAPNLDLEPGMLLVIQPNVVNPDAALGIQTGELVVVMQNGAERLHALPLGLVER